MIQKKERGGEGWETARWKMRDRAVKYLWSSPKEMLWERRNQQKNRKWESGSMLWSCAYVAGGWCLSCFFFSHTVISRCKTQPWIIQLTHKSGNPVEGADRHDAIPHPALLLKRSNNSRSSSKNSTVFCYASDLLRTLMYTIFFPPYFPPRGKIITHWNQFFFWPASRCGLKFTKDNPSKNCKRTLMFL